VALARANLAEAYEELGQTEEARALHATAYDELIAEVQQHEAKLEATKAEDKEESEQVGAEDWVPAAWCLFCLVVLGTGVVHSCVS
jgi:hypothetical protein